MTASGFGCAASVIGNGDFFPCADVTDRVNGLAFCIAVPVIVGIWETAVVDEADGRVKAPDWGVGTAGQSVGLDDTAEWVLTKEIVMKRKKLSLLAL